MNSAGGGLPVVNMKHIGFWGTWCETGKIGQFMSFSCCIVTLTLVTQRIQNKINEKREKFGQRPL